MRIKYWGESAAPSGDIEKSDSSSFLWPDPDNVAQERKKSPEIKREPERIHFLSLVPPRQQHGSKKSLSKHFLLKKSQFNLCLRGWQERREKLYLSLSRSHSLSLLSLLKQETFFSSGRIGYKSRSSLGDFKLFLILHSREKEKKEANMYIITP